MARVPGAKPPPLADLMARAHHLGYTVGNRVIRARIEGSSRPILAVELTLEPVTDEAVLRFKNEPDGARAIMARCPIDTSAVAPDNVQETDAIEAAAKALDAALEAHDRNFERSPT